MGALFYVQGEERGRTSEVRVPVIQKPFLEKAFTGKNIRKRHIAHFIYGWM